MKWLFSIILKPQIFSKKFIKSNFIPSNFEMKIWGFEGIERILFLPTHSIFSQLPNKQSEEYSKIILFIHFQSIFFLIIIKKRLGEVSYVFLFALLFLFLLVMLHFQRVAIDSCVWKQSDVKVLTFVLITLYSGKKCSCIVSLLFCSMV